jgi:hypothetical protein
MTHRERVLATLEHREGDRWIIRSGAGRIIAQMPAGALHFEQTYDPLAEGVPDHRMIGEAMAECMWGAVRTAAAFFLLLLPLSVSALGGGAEVIVYISPSGSDGGRWDA